MSPDNSGFETTPAPLNSHNITELQLRTFEEIVEALGELENAAEAARHLSGLARVPRISAIVMFMEEKEKEAIGRILEAAEKSSVEQKILESVRKTFSV